MSVRGLYQVSTTANRFTHPSTHASAPTWVGSPLTLLRRLAPAEAPQSHADANRRNPRRRGEIWRERISRGKEALRNGNDRLKETSYPEDFSENTYRNVVMRVKFRDAVMRCVEFIIA